jgi:hypothetical protein
LSKDDNSGELPTLFDETSATPLHNGGILSEAMANVAKNSNAVKKNGCSRATRKWQNCWQPALRLSVQENIRGRAESDKCGKWNHWVGLIMQPLFPKRCFYSPQMSSR